MMQKGMLRGNIYDLEAEVIYKGICCYCGACGAFCVEYINYEDGRPITKEKCYEIHGACYDFCPRTFFPILEMDRAIFGGVREDKALGCYNEIVTARTKDKKIAEKSQDGGIATALLTFALGKDIIDSAVVSKKSESEAWTPEAIVATTKGEIISGAGSKYTLSPTLLGVREAFDKGCEKIAFVGVPCQIQAMRKIQQSRNFDVGADRVKLLIGLMCTESFDRDALMKKLSENGIKIEDVTKFDISKGKFYAYTKDGEVTMPIKEMKSAMRDGCKVCFDFSAEFADISVGSIGSESGWSTVIVRTDEGKKLLDGAVKAGVIETKALSEENVEAVRKLAMRKKTENLDNILGVVEEVSLLNLVVSGEDLKLLLP
ncbi:MAG: Coenzyme F420 hydrogenase/dehydrogenase, beta subunit C-terminal domain [Halobacteriota archaeon]|nr:Coenzyme F420 hydrogenase/dehydrogenase, beta subunit C-terminal domain [Halobacteriota archaeon]